MRRVIALLHPSYVRIGTRQSRQRRLVRDTDDNDHDDARRYQAPAFAVDAGF